MDGRTPTGLLAPALEPLLRGLIDYAGTFPPASLPLADAAERFERHRRGPRAWVLARAAVSLADLAPLARWRAARGGDAAADPWPVTAVVGEAWDAASAAVREAGAALAVEACECRALDPAGVDAAVRALAPLGEVVVEVPADRPQAWPPLLDAIAERGARAKLRTGATVPEAVPDAALVARFLVECAERALPLKLTAGLHHARCGRRPLTYADDAPVGPMHGFLNAYAAAGLAVLVGAGAARVERCLRTDAPDAFVATAAGLALRVPGDDEVVLSTERLAELRERSIGAFGSCSFDEPLADLAALGWLQTTPG